MILAVDLGKKKTGTAILRDGTTIPFPYRLYREESRKTLSRALADAVVMEGIDELVFGMPYGSDGGETEWGVEIRRFAERFSRRVSRPLHFVAEGMSSRDADTILRGKKKKTKDEAQDLVAAVLILETYLREREKKSKT